MKRDTHVVRDCLTCAVREQECFCSLTPEALTSLQSIGTPVRFNEEHSVLREGNSADHVYLICQGRVKLTTSSPDGRTLLVRIAGPGTVLGMAAALNRTPHSVTAEPLEPCEMKAITLARFLRFMEQYRDVNRNTVLMIAREYEDAIKGARRLALSGSAAQKLANLLLDWGRNRAGDETQPWEFQMPLTHDELGSMAGLSRETVTRTLTRFQQEGLLERDGRRMILLQPSAMRTKYS